MIKLKKKLLKDIIFRSNSERIECSKRSLKVLIRLRLINYLAILDRLSKLNKQSNSCREKNRCFISSRSSGNINKVSISRIKFKELVNNGLILGFSKASW